MWVGHVVRRFEDDRLLRGQATYIEDMSRPGMAHICFVRSPYAHARIRDLDLSAARPLPGVVAIVTAQDLPSLASR